MEVSGYAKGHRYSDDIKAQRSAIRAYGRQHGLKVGHIVVEDDQAFGPVYHRDGGFLFTKKAKAGDVIIAARFADLFASAADALKVVAALERRGVALHVIDIGGDMASISKLFVTMATAFAEGGGKLASARIRQSKAELKVRGRYVGGKVPFGFKRRGSRLSKDKAQQEAIREIVEMRAAGKPLRAIAAAIVAKGHAISHEGVAGILRAQPSRPQYSPSPATSNAAILHRRCGTPMLGQRSCYLPALTAMSAAVIPRPILKADSPISRSNG
jgi:putative DNA-invertase from lambdoid prophage Rac